MAIIKYMPLAFAGLLLVAPQAYGFTLHNGVIVADDHVAPAYTGVGDNGVVITGRTMGPDTGGSGRFYIMTGVNPAKEGSATFSVAGVDAPGIRPVCVAMADWTLPEYSFGYPIPGWPWAFFYQSFYDVAAQTVTISWDVLDELEPYANYSVNVICGIRTARQ